MVSLRVLQSTSNASAAESTTSSAPSNSTSVTTKKQTTSNGQVITTTTTTTTTTTVSSSMASKSEDNANSMTTITTSTSNQEGASPVTTIVNDNGMNTTTTSTTKDAATGLTTVTTTVKSDSDMNGSASRSTTWTTTSGGSSSTAERSSTTSGTSQQTSTSTTTKSSSTEATTEGASTSTTASTESNSGGLITSGSNSETTTGSTSSFTYGSTNSNTNAAIVTGASSTSTSTSTTSTSSTTSSLTGSANDAASTTASSGERSTTTSTTSTAETSSTQTSSDGSLSSTTSSLSGSSSTTTSSSSSSSSSSALASWFTSNFRDEETQLVVSAKSSITTTGASHQVCDGLPALVTRSSTEKPNGGCPDELTALNASCTCITGYSETASSWVFHITTESWNSTTHTTTRSLTQSSSDELAINTIRPIWVSSSLESLELDGSRDSLAEITFIDENRETSSSSLSLVQSASNSTNITTFSIHNIDLNSVAKTNSDFVPATVTSLTLRNCNISTLSTSFTSEWSLLQYLDLSLNNINSEYIGGDYLKELNLSHNALAVFPAGSLNTSGLEALYIQGNNIKDFNVSQAQFEQIQGLTAFEADQPESSSTCRDGAWQSAHNTTFCVLGASTAAVPDSSQSSASTGDDDHDGLGLLAYWLIAGAIIVFFLLLLVIWQRRRHNNERESSPIVSPESIEPTTPKYNANDAFDDALNHDNVAPAAYTAKKSADAEASSVGGKTTPAETKTAGTVGAASVNAVGGAYPSGYGRSHGGSVDSEDTALGASLANNSALASCRLDYADVTLGRCISRGGFGLVFVGSYRGRQVAVKKIRNERDVEREQVEQFVREISLISGLSHPRIVEFIGACWTTPAELSAVTELMERGDLRDVTRRFKRRGYRLTWEAHKTVIALHIAEALTYLHGLSPTVIHRDLKAKNVLLNADMEAKLSDFGIARERSSYDGTEHMTVGIGTSFWIAPEVLLGRDYDERADIYSFGVVLSEIDTDDYPYWNAQHPPQGKVQENEILRLVARGAKRPAFSDDCPPAILELAAHCLRADPDERPSASEIVIYLQQLVQERTSSASFSSISQQRQSFDFNMHSTNSSSPTRTAPTNTIVNLRSSSGQMIQQIQAPSAAAAHAAGKRTKKLTTTTTTTRFTALSVDTDSGSDSRPTAVEALAPAHEMVVSSPQVTHHVVRTKIPAKGKRSTTTATTTRTQQGSTSSTTSSFVTSMAAGSSDSSGRSFSSESVPSSRSHLGPTSPSSLRANHQAAFDNINQQRQLSPTSADEKKREATDTNRQWQKWTVYEDVREL